MPWKPVDNYALPFEEDMKNALHAIRQLELDIEDEIYLTDADLARLLNDLDELRAWIAPVRRIPFEILTKVIIMSAEDVWWSSAVIAGVCRYWREVALATPRAWSFINLKSRPPLALTSMFFERSGSCILHVAVPTAPYGDGEAYATIVARITNRIECLVLTGTSVALLYHKYSRLTRLSITDPSTPIPLEYLTVRSFPNLRYISGHFSAPITRALSVDPPSPSPIECLVLTTDQNAQWIAVIREFSKTLKALHITIGVTRVLPSYISLQLPRVVHLSITSAVRHRVAWRFMAKTPALKTYSTIEGDGVYSAELDVASVTHLQSWEPISLLPYTKLRQLHIHDYKADSRTTLAFIDQLSGDRGTCVDLECIVLGSWNALDRSQITRRLKKRSEYTGVDLKILPAGLEDGIWPVNINVACPLGMPCNDPPEDY